MRMRWRRRPANWSAARSSKGAISQSLRTLKSWPRRIGRELPVHVAQPMDDRQPAAQHFFHAYDGAGDRLLGYFHARAHQLMAWIALIGENR
jgi:hypothetical protein